MIHAKIAKQVIQSGIDSLKELNAHLPADITPLIDHILQQNGRVILVGMGKSGHIAKKIAASLASTGTPSFYIHPGEASHGDLGMITIDDTVIMLSNSGETSELFDTINYCKRFDIKIAGFTMKPDSTLGRNSDFLLTIPSIQESSDLAAPTNSALLMLSLGHALITCLHVARGFTKEQYKNFHPGGKIGANLLTVKDLMHSGNELPLTMLDTPFNELIMTITSKALGCAIIVNDKEELLGVVTDGDLRRHINDQSIFNLTAKDLMSQNPITINPKKLATEALSIMNKNSITTLIVSDANKISGILHIHDILKAGVE